jgi:hypothetical protein
LAEKRTPSSARYLPPTNNQRSSQVKLPMGFVGGTVKRMPAFRFCRCPFVYPTYRAYSGREIRRNAERGRSRSGVARAAKLRAGKFCLQRFAKRARSQPKPEVLFRRYLSDCCPIFRRVTKSVNLPALPRTPPQNDHERTTRKISFFQNPCQKHRENGRFRMHRRPSFFPENLARNLGVVAYTQDMKILEPALQNIHKLVVPIWVGRH